MTVEEVRAIREIISLEAAGMTTDELHAYFAKGAAKMEERIAEIRKEKGIVLKVAKNSES